MTTAAERRRVFLLIAGVLAVLGLAVALRPGTGVDTVAAPAPATESLSDPSATTSATTDEMPAAWLAWISGSLRRSFADRAARTQALGTTVVVAGDTRWLVRSEDPHGDVVDHPTPPFAIPIDAFAVDPDAYAPFLPAAYRDRVTAVLDAGEGVLGASSAALRRLDVGGTLVFEGGDVLVGAIVPDEVAGWSEVLVSRATGRRLGIVDDRYLLSMPGGGMTEGRFASIVAGLLPDTDVRTVEPGGSRFMRIASGVNPPVVMKQVFGEFSAYPRQADPAYLTMSPAWYDANIQTRSVPLLGKVTCNEALFDALIGALRDVQAAGLGNEIHTYSGCYAARTVARSTTAPPSQHAYGAAIDIDAPTNAMGDTTPAMDPRVVEVFERWGFNWGGDFVITDGMHFEYGSSSADGSLAA
jgi:hypothetical protein